MWRYELLTTGFDSTVITIAVYTNSKRNENLSQALPFISILRSIDGVPEVLVAIELECGDG